jgi:hypothetical protein
MAVCVLALPGLSSAACHFAGGLCRAWPQLRAKPAGAYCRSLPGLSFFGRLCPGCSATGQILVGTLLLWRRAISKSRELRLPAARQQVVDLSSIEVKRQKRRRKTDRFDAGKLLSMLICWHRGERKVWSIVQVPSVADEDRRQLHRNLLELKAERTQHRNRLKGLLAGCGLAVPTVGADFLASCGCGTARRCWIHKMEISKKKRRA